MIRRDKRGIEIEMLTWWIIGIAVLVIAIGVIMVLKGKGSNAIDFIRNLFRFGS